MKKLYLILILVFSIGFVAAHEIYANMDGGLKSENTFEYKYDKGDFYEKDFDYKYERKVDDEWTKKGLSAWDKRNFEKKYGKWNEHYDKWEKDVDEQRHYYKYVDHMRKWEEKSCYDSPPKGKLFYIKC